MTEVKKRSKIPYFFLAFFIVVVSVNIAYVYISKKTWRGVATEDSYRKGLNYNDTIKQVKKQNNLGWIVGLKYQRTGDSKGVLIVNLLDRDSQPIIDADIYVTFKRPTQSGFDFVQKFDTNSGVYRTEVIFPLRGQWDAEIVITRGQDIFQTVKRYVI